MPENKFSLRGYELPPLLIRFLCQTFQHFSRHASHTELFGQVVESFSWKGFVEYVSQLEVIEFRDSYEAPTTIAATGSTSEGTATKKGRTVAFTTEDLQKRKNDVKARTTLLLALPDEHQLRFTKNNSRKEDVNTASIPTAGTNISPASVNIGASFMENEEEDHALVADEEAPTEFALMAKTSADSEAFTAIESTFDDAQNKNPSVPETGASPSNISYLSDYEPFDRGYVSFGQGGCKITGKETIKTGKLEFKNVYFVKDLKYNLFSVSQIYDNKNSVLFTDSKCIVLGRDFKLIDDTNVLLRTPKQHNMYSIDLNNVVPHKDLTCLVAKASADECMLWHKRLGHLNFKTMNKLVRHNLVRGLPTKCFENDHNCTACLKGKQHKASCKTKLLNLVTKPFYTLHIDLFGPTSDETSGIRRNFITEIENLKKLRAKIIRCDNRGEFINKEMNDFCLRKGIKREFSNAKTLHQNRIAKRRNKTLIEAARTMLADAKLPVTFWAEAANTACYVQNRVLVNKSQNKTPYELFNGRTPAIGFLKPFSCHVMILNTLENLGKFEAKGDEGYFIRYSMSSKAFKVFNKRTKRVEENLHVDFLENKPIEKGAGPNWLFDIDYLTNFMNYMPVVVAGTNSTNFSGTKEATGQYVKKDVSSLRYIVLPNWFHETHLESSTSNAQDTCSADAPESSGNSNPTTTLTNPLADHIETLAVETLIPTVSSPVPTACLNDSPEPSSDTRLISKRVTSQDDTPSLDNILTLINRFEDILGVTTNTDDTNGVEDDLGNMETTITASPTPTLRIHKDHLKRFIVYQMDMKSAFLYGTIDEEVGTIDQTLFIRRHEGDFILVQVYGDDIIFGSSNLQLCREFEALMHEKFQMSAMGELNFFLGLESLGKDGAGKDVDLHLYRSMIGSLMYLTTSTPDIMFVVCACARHQVTPKESHLHAVKRIFRYLKGHPKLGLWYPKESPFDLVAYLDSDYGGAFQDRKSTTRGIETTEEGTKIFATVDGKLRIVSESSIRRNLKLNDEAGINKPASPIRDGSQREACLTDSGLEADQDRANIPKTSTLPSDSTARVTSLAADDGTQELEINRLKARIKLLEDKDRRVAEQSGDDAPIKGRRLDKGEEAAERVSDDKEEMVTVLTSIDAASILTSGGVQVVPIAAEVATATVSIPTGSGVVSTASPTIPTASPIFTTATQSTPYTRRKGKETMVESKTPKKKKVQEQIDVQLARELEEEMARDAHKMNEQIARDAEIVRIHAEEELQIMIDGLDRNNESVVKYLQEYHQFATELPIGRRIELISDLVKYQDNYAKEEAERFKRKGLRLEQESVNKLKTSEEVKATEEVLEEKVKEMMQLVPIEEVYVEALQVKHPIIDWKVHTEGQRSYWKIIRLGGSSASYQFFVDMLKHLDREDLNQLWTLVKETLNIRPASSDKKMEIWVELKRLFELDVEDYLWTHTQNLMHAPVEWKLYDTCGVHHVSTKDQDIFMLIEKDYPLRKGLGFIMISYKLQVENYSQMANDLILKIYKIANCPRQQDD
nr:hypothetical protein [Tanacetum cinerariifolium]